MKQTEESQEMSRLEFARRIRAQLEVENSSLDAATLSRLRQAREQALAIAGRKQRIAWHWWPARLGLATAALLVVFIAWQLLPAERDSSLAGMEDDLEILIAEDDVNFYADMEFMIWLEQQDHAG
jgi:negative regulator of sigma E activity